MKVAEVIELLSAMMVSRENEHDIWFNGEYLGTIVKEKESPGMYSYLAGHEMTDDVERHFTLAAAIDSYVANAYTILEADIEPTVEITVQDSISPVKMFMKMWGKNV